MKAVVFHDIGDIRLEEVPDPQIQEPTDAVIRLTASAICGTDLHFVRGTMAPVNEGTILGHEGVGIVEEVGADVRNLQVGDRVVVGSTIGCGNCSYCRAGYYAQCDRANPNGHDAGTAFFGGPANTGPFDGLQAERGRIPFASVTLVKLPDTVSDDQAILISDIFPTGYFGAHMADIKPGHTVCVWGCGPVGIFAVIGARLFGAGRIFAVDRHPDRLEMARRQGAETIDFSREDPVETLKRLTDGIGPDSAIDAVGAESERPHSGPAAEDADQVDGQFQEEIDAMAPDRVSSGEQWRPGGRAVAGLALGRREPGQGRHALDRRRLPPDPRCLPDRCGHEQEPHHPDGQLQPPALHPASRGPGGRRHGRSRGRAHRDRHHERSHRGLRGLRPARRGLAQGEARGSCFVNGNLSRFRAGRASASLSSWPSPTARCGRA
ncbi:MAG: alcohol dehydrogenase catalytic domain-containing protein [Thermoleophilaceae bacterium]